MTSYLMMAQHELRDQTRTTQNISILDGLKKEAGLDAEVSRLFEMQRALSQLPTQNLRLPAVDADAFNPKLKTLQNPKDDYSFRTRHSLNQRLSAPDSTGERP